MKHKCTNCGKIYEKTDNIINGCKCGNNRFFFIKTRKNVTTEEKDEENETLVCLEIETIKIIKPGKYEIDIKKLLETKLPIYNYSDGKYSIDIENILKLE